MTTLTKYGLLAATAALLGAFSPQAPSQTLERSLSVRVSDLNLDEAADVEVLYARLRRAASRVCDMPGPPFLDASPRECGHEALAEAVASASVPALTSRHAHAESARPSPAERRDARRRVRDREQYLARAANRENGRPSVAVLTDSVRGAAPLPAGEHDRIIQTRAVRYSDLDLREPVDVSVLYARLQKAAHRVCRQGGAALDRSARTCVREALGGAVGSARIPVLTARHAQALSAERPKLAQRRQERRRIREREDDLKIVSSIGEGGRVAHDSTQFVR